MRCPAFQVLRCWVCIRVWAEKKKRSPGGILRGGFFVFFFSFWLAFLCCVGWNAFFVIFTSYISSGRCIIMENFIPPYAPRVFVCGQDARKESSTLNTRGHKLARNAVQVAPDCVQQARGSHVFLHLRWSEQGPRSPSNPDIC